MFTKTFAVAALATIASAAPVEQRQASPAFGLISTRSGDINVHLRTIVANGQRFWLGKETATYCPEVEGLDCATGTSSPPSCSL